MNVAQERRLAIRAKFQRAARKLAILKAFSAKIENDPLEPKLPEPPKDIRNDTRALSRWYFDQVYGEFSEETVESALRQLIRTTCQYAESFREHWRYTDTSALVRSKGNEVIYQGSADGLVSFMGKVQAQDALAFGSIILHTSSAASDRADVELQRLNRHIAEYLRGVVKAEAFDKYRRCGDAYYGNIEQHRLTNGKVDLNQLSVIRIHPEFVETIQHNSKGHFLLVKSQVIMVNGKLKCLPPVQPAPALHYAVLADKAGSVKQFLQSGASRHTESACGATAMDIAIANNCARVLQVLDPHRTHRTEVKSTIGITLGSDADAVTLREKRMQSKRNTYIVSSPSSIVVGTSFTHSPRGAKTDPTPDPRFSASVYTSPKSETPRPEPPKSETREFRADSLKAATPPYVTSASSTPKAGSSPVSSPFGYTAGLGLSGSSPHSVKATMEYRPSDYGSPHSNPRTSSPVSHRTYAKRMTDDRSKHNSSPVHLKPYAFDHSIVPKVGYDHGILDSPTSPEHSKTAPKGRGTDDVREIQNFPVPQIGGAHSPRARLSSPKGPYIRPAKIDNPFEFSGVSLTQARVRE